VCLLYSVIINERSSNSLSAQVVARRAARLFTIVDVWNALRSDRPYRPAWSEQEALDYIREQSGKHFDPQVVEAFLNMIE
jgi:hypothetical protein